MWPCHSAGMKTTPKPSRSQFAVLRQIGNLIPSHLVPKLARETGVDKKARTFSPWSHLRSLLHAQLTHAIGLNCATPQSATSVMPLRRHGGLLVTLRGATPPRSAVGRRRSAVGRRANLSHANKERDASLAEKVFWAVLGHLQGLPPGFARRSAVWRRAAAARGSPGVFGARFTSWTRPRSNWSPPAWTGPGIAAAKPLPSVTCDSICTAFCRALPSSIPPVTTTPSVRANSAPPSAPGKWSSSTRPAWTSHPSSISCSGVSPG